MAITKTELTTGLTGSSAYNLPAEYEAVNVYFDVTVPAWIGRTTSGGRTVYFGAGYVAAGYQDAPAMPPEPLRMGNQLVMAGGKPFDRLLYWLPPGVSITVEGITYS